MRSYTDGVVTIRPMRPGDAAALIAGRDAEFRRFLGEGHPDPQPVAVVEVEGTVVGWVDHDHDHDHAWLEDGEVNVGYALVPEHRGRGYATRAVVLLLRYLAEETDWRVATLLIAPDNARSLALARRAGFTRVGDLDGNPYFKRPVTEAARAGRTRAPRDRA